MAGIIEYVRAATESFLDRPLNRVDSLCLSWLAYLHYPSELGTDTRSGMRLTDIVSLGVAPLMVAQRRNPTASRDLLEAMAASPRFSGIRACLHQSVLDETKTMQFSATTFVLPDRMGSYVAYRGTDDSTLGWKENFFLGGARAVAAQQRAVRYFEDTSEELGGRFWVGGHSKGGNLADYVRSFAGDAARMQLEGCFSHDGPGLSPELRRSAECRSDVPLNKTIPQESLVGMIFERSQEDFAVVRSGSAGVWQHDPFSWEVAGRDFALWQGMSYEAWRLAQRLNDWLSELTADGRDRFAELLGLLVDATAETSFSGLLRRWSSNRLAMQAVLEHAPRDDREFFEHALDDLAATLLLGSKAEHGIGVGEGVQERASAAARRLEDASARAKDRLSKLDRLAGL